MRKRGNSLKFTKLGGEEKRRVVWISANIFGYEMLKTALMIDDIEIVGIVTLNKQAKTKMYDGIKKQKWHEFDIPVYGIKNINESATLLKKLAPDLIIVCGWRQIIDKEILDMPKKGVVGFHPALLPKGRGPAPIINTILEGFNRSGVTMYYFDGNVDGGDIVGKVPFCVGSKDYAGDIYQKVIDAGRELLRDYLPKLVDGTAPRIKQDDRKATYFKKRTLKDNEIRLSDSIETANRRIRAFSEPYNGAFVKFGKKKITIWRGEAG